MVLERYLKARKESKGVGSGSAHGTIVSFMRRDCGVFSFCSLFVSACIASLEIFTSFAPVEQIGEMGSRRRFGGGESERI
jgi:hypothetical protein